ncbi:MAG TPA: hypothetical protein VFI54_26730 [Solirubrobacteraceae bacterium]|nr:hypothetical protein [Solirubrobacteraceae bacterium]
MTGTRPFAAGLACVVGLLAAPYSASAATWTVQAAPVPAGSYSLGDVVCLSMRDCIAVGGGVGRPVVARWNGTRWSRGPSGAAAGYFLGVDCASSKSCVAVGVTSHTACDKTLAESWNGFGWGVQPTPHPWACSSDHGATTTDVRLTDVSCRFAATCLAVGNVEQAACGATKRGARIASCGGDTGPLVERRRGNRWTIMKTDFEGVSAISCVSGGCTAVGDSQVGRFDGKKWTVRETLPLGAVFGTLNDVSCAATDACVAVGSGSGGRPLVERFDGRRSIVDRAVSPSGATLAELNAVSCPSRAACIAVGDYFTKGDKKHLPLVERWNGFRWSLDRTALPRRTSDLDLAGVSCVSASACVAVGYYTTRDMDLRPLIESTMPR